MLTRILPNNNRVLALLDANRKLLRKDERGSLELFRQHVDDLQAYHIEGLKSDASRFPAAMTSILATWLMVGSITEWVASRLNPNNGLRVVGRTPEDLLLVQFQGNEPFPVAAIGVKDVILPENVQPLLLYATRPQFIVNVPSKTLWSGDAISLINAAPPAFGTLGEISKAAHSGDVPNYRNKNWEFFETAIKPSFLL